MRSEDMPPGADRAKVWFAEQVDGFHELQGRRISAWRGTEWAIRIDDDSGSEGQFEDPSVPCLQLAELFAVVETEVAMRIWAPQQDDGFGLGIDQHARTNLRSGGIQRHRESLPLPTGRVDRIRVRVENSMISEVVIGISGLEILLVAGEVSDAWGEPLQWHRFDEQVLAFSNASDADRIDWTPPRQHNPSVLDCFER